MVEGELVAKGGTALAWIVRDSVALMEGCIIGITIYRYFNCTSLSVMNELIKIV